MKIALKNGYLVTPTAETFKVEQRDLYIMDGILHFEKPFDTADREIDLNRKIVMPGLVNAHHHIYSALSKGIAVEGPLKDFNGTLEKLWWKLDRVLEKQDVIDSTVVTMRESIQAGVSTVFDHHISVPFTDGSLTAMGDVFKKYGVNGVLCYEISDRNGKEVFEASLKENIDFYNQHKNDPYLKGTIGIHASFTVGEESMAQIKKVIGDAPIHIHTAEDAADVVATKEICGLPVVERLEKHGLLNDNSLIVHGNVLTDNEIKILKSKNIFMVHNPESNMNNTLKIRNISDTLDKGLTLTVGTDGMTSNMLKSYKSSFLLNRFLHQDPDTGWGEMHQVFLNAFKLKTAYGFPLGVEDGKEADLVVVDYQPATPFNDGTFLGHFVFGLTESRPQYLIKKDRILLDDFKVTIEEDYDYHKKVAENTAKLFERFENLK